MKRMLASILACSSLLVPALGEAQSAFGSDFDHFTTGFRLDGAHATVDCESCHVGAVFQGTPIECSGCHSDGGRIEADAKPANHVLSTNFCEDCHRTTAWFPLAEMNHDAIFGTCSGCHNDVQSVGKPPDHPLTRQECSTCHGTTGWFPARFDHFGVVGDCASCHDGTTADGKPTTHITSGETCEDCHTTNAWLPANFNHDMITGTCVSCHNGVEADGKSVDHVLTTDICEDCHTVTAFAPAIVDHAQVLGSCSNCHDGTTATGKDTGHFTTTYECDHCHTRDFWAPLTLDHVSATYPGDHRGNLDCTDCHSSNAEDVPWPFPAYAPDCAGCHASDYRLDPHRNATVSELRDCAGSCHQSRPEHSVNSREW
jgi:hypothetical protein